MARPSLSPRPKVRSSSFARLAAAVRHPATFEGQSHPCFRLPVRILASVPFICTCAAPLFVCSPVLLPAGAIHHRISTVCIGLALMRQGGVRADIRQRDLVTIQRSTAFVITERGSLGESADLPSGVGFLEPKLLGAHIVRGFVARLLIPAPETSLPSWSRQARVFFGDRDLHGGLGAARVGPRPHAHRALPRLHRRIARRAVTGPE